MVLAELVSAAVGSIAGDKIQQAIGKTGPVVQPGIWARTYKYKGNNGELDQIDTLAANGYAMVNISENHQNQYAPFNGGFIQNNSDEVLEVLLSGDENRVLHIAAKASGSLANHKFNTIVLKNLSATTPSNNEISVTIQKIKEVL